MHDHPNYPAGAATYLARADRAAALAEEATEQANETVTEFMLAHVDVTLDDYLGDALRDARHDARIHLDDGTEDDLGSLDAELALLAVLTKRLEKRGRK